MMPRFLVTAALLLALLATGCAESAGPAGPLGPEAPPTPEAPSAPEAPSSPETPPAPPAPSGSAADFDRVQAEADMDAFVRGLESFTNNTLLTGFREIDELVQAGGLTAGLNGVTFEFDIASGKYKQSDEPGAPAGAVRFLLYGVSPDRQFLPTLDELGYIDLTRQDNGARRIVRLVASLTGTTVADYTGWAEGDASRGGYGLEGWVIMAGHRVEFDLAGTSQPSGSGRRDSLDATIALDDRDYLVDGNVVTDDNGSSPRSALMVDYRSRGGAAKVTGAADGAAETRAVSLNGEAYATSQQPASSEPVYVGVAPHEVTTDEAAFFSELETLNETSRALAVWTARPVWRMISLSFLFNQ